MLGPVEAGAGLLVPLLRKTWRAAMTVVTAKRSLGVMKLAFGTDRYEMVLWCVLWSPRSYYSAHKQLISPTFHLLRPADRSQ